LIKEKEGGYSVYCPELDIYSEGEDVEDALKKLKEPAELHVEEGGIENLKRGELQDRKLELTI